MDRINNPSSFKSDWSTFFGKKWHVFHLVLKTLSDYVYNQKEFEREKVESSKEKQGIVEKKEVLKAKASKGGHFWYQT